MKFYKQIFYFNKSAFILAGVLVCIGLAVLFLLHLSTFWFWAIIILLLGTLYLTGISLFASYYIYDHSPLYSFSWLRAHLPNRAKLYNVIAGYAESGNFLQTAFPGNDITHLDFFEESITVTSSIQIAKGHSENIKTDLISYKHWQHKGKADLIIFMQSLHELRTASQKTDCLLQAKQHLQKDGKIVVAEHLCDWKNLFIYGPGAFHFFGYRHYKKVFEKANLQIKESFTITPFVRVFIMTL